MIRQAIAIVLLVIFGSIKMPVEKFLDAAQEQAGLRNSRINVELRERVGQMGFLAALSGFRSPVAALLWLKAHNAWERTAVGAHGRLCSIR